ncbi:hypothetical protein MTO96_048951 [Rhipicephalus appendiculatus]
MGVLFCFGLISSNDQVPLAAFALENFHRRVCAIPANITNYWHLSSELIEVSIADVNSKRAARITGTVYFFNASEVIASHPWKGILEANPALCFAKLTNRYVVLPASHLPVLSETTLKEIRLDFA